MTDERLVELRTVTDATGTTINQGKYWCKLLRVEILVRGRVAHVRPADAEKLRAVADLVAAGRSPGEAVTAITGESTITTPRVVETAPAVVADPHHDALAQIRDAVSLIARELADTRRENAELHAKMNALTIMFEQRRQLPPLLLEPPVRVQPWSPEPKADPAKAMSPIKRLWLELVDPVSLRRH